MAGARDTAWFRYWQEYVGREMQVRATAGT